MATLKLFAGSDATFALDFGAGYNLAGKTIVLTGKISEAQPDVDAPIIVTQDTHVDATHSTLFVPGAMTAALGGKTLFGWLQVRSAPAPAAPETIDDLRIQITRAPA